MAITASARGAKAISQYNTISETLYLNILNPLYVIIKSKREPMKPHFMTRPNFTYNHTVNGSKYFSMDAPLIFWDGKKKIIIDNADFFTNFASIPKIATKLTGIKPDRETMQLPSALHDDLYGKKTILNRVYSDWMFLKAMKAEGENFFIRWSAFLAVRAFGSEYY